MQTVVIIFGINDLNEVDNALGLMHTKEINDRSNVDQKNRIAELVQLVAKLDSSKGFVSQQPAPG